MGNNLISIIKQIRQQYLVFLFFVALSAIVWFIQALRDTYVADIKYPVKYINLPPNRILSHEPTTKLILRVRSDGFTLLINKIKIKRPLPYNVNSFRLYSLATDSTSVYTLTRYANDKLTSELDKTNSKIEIIKISPDTLFFNFSKVKRKKVKVNVQITNPENICADQYMLNGPAYSIPDSVIVTGPFSIIDTLTGIPTEPLLLSNLSDTIFKKTRLVKLNKLDYNLQKVKAVVPVDEFTEMEFDIPLSHKDVPDSFILKTFPNIVRITHLVTLSNMEKVSAEEFHPFVVFPTEDFSVSSRLRVQFDSVPDFIHAVNISPRSVEFLIKINDEENRNNRGNR
ncbi:MAG: hypothetical protein JW894_08140 [Bacteroidales bacterium]|nr:hypothetical protein [Bacteroidales bacterium]